MRHSNKFICLVSIHGRKSSSDSRYFKLAKPTKCEGYLVFHRFIEVLLKHNLIFMHLWQIKFLIVNDLCGFQLTRDSKEGSTG